MKFPNMRAWQSDMSRATPELAVRGGLVTLGSLTTEQAKYLARPADRRRATYGSNDARIQADFQDSIEVAHGQTLLAVARLAGASGRAGASAFIQSVSNCGPATAGVMIDKALTYAGAGDESGLAEIVGPLRDIAAAAGAIATREPPTRKIELTGPSGQKYSGEAKTK